MMGEKVIEVKVVTDVVQEGVNSFNLIEILRSLFEIMIF